MLILFLFIFRDMVRSLLLGYFHAPASQRSDVLLVMGRVLNFSQVEIEQVAIFSNASVFYSKSLKKNVLKSRSTSLI